MASETISRPARLGLIVLAFTLVGVFFAGQVWLDYAYSKILLTGLQALLLSLADWWLWALLTPAIVALARRVRIGRGNWVRAIFVHLAVGVGLTIVKMIAKTAIEGMVLGGSRSPVTFLQVYVTFLTYWVIVGAAYWLESLRDSRRRERRAAQLETELARAHVDALRARLHPHFLFNTLNTIAGLMREDVEAADVMMARLSDLLRVTLEQGDAQEIPLRRELELLDLYLAIQKVRYGDRLAVTVSCEPSAIDCLVPTFLLQPLVENALRHGIATIPGPGRLDVGVRHEPNGTLLIEVRDNGPGPEPRSRDGLGLENTRARLQALYGDRASLTLTKAPCGGAAARVTLPIRLDDGNRSVEHV